MGRDDISWDESQYLHQSDLQQGGTQRGGTQREQCPENNSGEVGIWQKLY